MNDGTTQRNREDKATKKHQQQQIKAKESRKRNTVAIRLMSAMMECNGRAPASSQRHSAGSSPGRHTNVYATEGQAVNPVTSAASTARRQHTAKGFTFNQLSLSLWPSSLKHLHTLTAVVKHVQLTAAHRKCNRALEFPISIALASPLPQ